MADVNAPRALSPADRMANGQRADYRTRTGALPSFSSLVRRPPEGSFPALRPMARSNHLADSQSGAEAVPETSQARGRRDSEGPSELPAEPTLEVALDPFVCQLAVNPGLSSFVQPDPSSSLAPVSLPLREDLQNLLTGLTRRTAWGGDRRKGSARIELSEGSLAGATLVVHAEQRSVSVELELPPGVIASGWQQRITQRLEARGFAAKVEVG